MKIILIVLSFCIPLSVAGQQPAFETASIKPADSRSRGVHTLVHAESIDFQNVTVMDCILRAYRVLDQPSNGGPIWLEDFQVTGGPAWIRTERYTITAKSAGPAPEDQILLMVRALLADRFGLRIRREAKPTPVLALVVAGSKPRLVEATDDDGPNSTGPDTTGRETVFVRESMPVLTLRLKRYVDRTVVDATGLTGIYNFKLPLTAQRRGSNGALESSDPSDADGSASLSTILQERLGLKLVSRKVPIDILVIDHVERPSGN